MQMIEELLLALIMSLVFALPAWYLCIFQGSFAVFWLAWLLSLADGIGARLLLIQRTRPVRHDKMQGTFHCIALSTKLRATNAVTHGCP